jgi:hypothetical protein
MTPTLRPTNPRTSTLFAFTVLALAAFAPACGGDDDHPLTTVPSVETRGPVVGAMDVPINGNVSASFNVPMDPDSLNTTTFTVTSNNGTVTVPGTVIYADDTAVFWPTAHFAADTTFTVTITTGAMSAAGIPLGAPVTWMFTTGSTLAPVMGVNLRTAGGFVILAKAGISTVPPSVITGDIGVSPAAATYITEFALMAHASNEYATSSQVIGRVYASTYAEPTPTNLTAAVSNMELAYTDAASRAPDATELGAGDISGMTLEAGVYAWGTGLLISTDITLTGNATDVFIFQIAQNLTVSNGVNIILAGNVQPKNIFWQVAGSATFGTTSHMEGIVLSQTSITMQTGASINGRLFAQTAVDVASATVSDPE